MEYQMTLHISYNHQCPQCQAFYIPYDTNVPCPKCGCIEEKRFDFIPQAAASALCNLDEGSYLPEAWLAGTFVDQALFLVFRTLEAHRTADEAGDFTDIARAFFDSLNWGDYGYAREHIFGIACRVFEEIQKRPAPNARGD
jgi:hypothetical protein